MADTTTSVTETLMDTPTSNGYIPRGNTGFSEMFFSTNTDLALFSNNDWRFATNRDTHFSLDSYTWYPEMYDDATFTLNNDNGYFINANIFNAQLSANSKSTDNMPAFGNYKKYIPTIKLRAFKPNLSDAAGLATLFKTGIALVDNIMKLDKSTMSQVMKNAFSMDTINQTLKNGLKSVCFKSNIDNQDYDNFSFLYDGVNAIYRRIVAGVYMSSYEMPFYPDNNTPFIHGGNSDAFKQNTLGDGIVGQILKVFGNAFGNMDILYSLEWNPPASYDTVEYSFKLFNRKSDDVYKNLRFIHSLIPEAMWFQNGIFQIPNTLYDVEIPGRTRYYWCAGEFDCKYNGKTRYFTAYNSNKLYETINIVDLKNMHDSWSNADMDIVSLRNALQEKVYEASSKKTELEHYVEKSPEIEAQIETLGKEIETYTAKINELENKIRKVMNSTANDNTRQRLANVSLNATTNDIRDLNLIPDVYEMHAKLTSILPSNLNTYLYGMFEHNNAVPLYGEGVDRFVQSFVRNFSIELLKTSLSKIHREGIYEDSAKATIESVLNALEDLN